MSSDFRSFLRLLQDEASLVLAVAGDGAGALEISDRPNYIYSRLDSESGQIIEVHTSIIRPNYDDYIYVAQASPFSPSDHWRLAFWLRDGTNVALGPPIVGGPLIRHGLLDDVLEFLVDDSLEFLEDGS